MGVWARGGKGSIPGQWGCGPGEGKVVYLVSGGVGRGGKRSIPGQWVCRHGEGKPLKWQLFPFIFPFRDLLIDRSIIPTSLLFKHGAFMKSS